MILTVASFKGGVGKTTSAVHLAAYLQRRRPTLLIDGDLNRSATGWAGRGGLPFRVVDERQAARYARDYDHIVIDTAARPAEEDLKALADGCDLLIIPTTPDALALEALKLTIGALERLGAARYRVLLTIVPPKPSRDGDEARSTLGEAGLPLFKTGIRRLAAFQKAALGGQLVSEVNDPRAPFGWEDYASVGKEIAG
ncbi:MAG: ParA family protein [Bryobacterales bacterium]|jgi:chromosome partitioning protein|nr:ParA family protein [Bryobacterales bacterium]